MDISQLTDFSPAKTGLDRPVLELLRELEQQPAPLRVPCEKESFLALLAAIPALRKNDGIPPIREDDPAAFAALPRCATPEDAAACRAQLRELTGIVDRQTLVDFCNQEIRCQNLYLDFEAFWEGRPPFDPETLGENKKNFVLFRDFAAQFYPMLQRHGFAGWDISECMGYLRIAYACGILTREEVLELGDYWIAQAQTFHDWGEYAVSLVCGQVYWNFLHGAKDQQLREGQELFLRLARMLLGWNNAWGGGAWYAPPQKKPFAIPAADIRPLLRDWEGPRACLATDQVTVLDLGVGYCYREEPEDTQFPDSGWRFFSGQESQEYIDDLDHTAIYDLNTIANYDPEIMTILDAPYGSAFGRGRDGKFYPEPFPGGEK